MGLEHIPWFPASVPPDCKCPLPLTYVLTWSRTYTLVLDVFVVKISAASAFSHRITFFLGFTSWLGWNNPRNREIEPDRIYAEKHFKFCKLSVNQECVLVMMKADCILGCINKCSLQVDGGDIFPLPFCYHETVSGACCPVFGSPMLRKTLTKELIKCRATKMLQGLACMSCQERLWGEARFFQY